MAGSSRQQQQSLPQSGLQGAQFHAQLPTALPQPIQSQPLFHHGSDLPAQTPLSLGTFPGIPTKFISKIQRGEYVDFHLLYSAIVFGSTSKPGFALLLEDQSENATPGLSLVPKEVETQKARIRNFAQWIRTWNKFMTVFLHFRPNMVSQLLAYQESISQMASTYFVAYWLTYDAGFRLKRANNQFLPWDIEDTELFIAYLRTAPVLASAALPVSSAAASGVSTSAVTKTTSTGSSGRSASGKRCYNCQRYGHIAQQCNYATVAPTPPPSMTSQSAGMQATNMPVVPPTNDNIAAPPFRAPQRNFVRPSQASGFCFEWNNTGQPCPRGCQRDHRCSWCSDTRHPRRDCPTWPGNQPGGHQ